MKSRTLAWIVIGAVVIAAATWVGRKHWSGPAHERASSTAKPLPAPVPTVRTGAPVSAARKTELFNLLHSSAATPDLFDVYAEVSSSTGEFRFVVYSEREHEADGNDQQYSAFIAVVGAASGGQPGERVWDKADVSGAMEFMAPDLPGMFAAMDGRLTAFVLPSGSQGVEVNVWSVISGTGQMSKGGDLVFSLSAEKRLLPLLRLEQTSAFMAQGADHNMTVDSTIYLVQDGNGAVAEIVQEERSRDNMENPSSPEYTRVYVLYRWDGAKFAETGALDDPAAAGKTAHAPRAARCDVPEVVIPAGVVPG